MYVPLREFPLTRRLPLCPTPSYNAFMGWLGLFNIAYGALGLAAAIYLGRPEGIALCVWVIGVGVAMRMWLPLRIAFRSGSRRRRIVARARLAV